MKLATLVAVSALLGLAASPQLARPVAPRSSANALPMYVQWLRVDTLHPRTLFLGGRFTCTRYLDGQQCPLWVIRSTDGGMHWSDLRGSISHEIALFYDPFFASPSVDYELSPVVIARDGKHVYMDAFVSGSASSSYGYVISSSDGGLDWRRIGGSSCGGSDEGGGVSNVSVSPIRANRVYVVDNGGGGEVCGIDHSNNAGKSFMIGRNPATLIPCPRGCYPWGALVADLARVNTVYANVLSAATDPMSPAYVARSDDAGLHWSLVMTPTAPPLRTFSVSTDPHEGTQLVGQTQDKDVPADRRYLSRDEGRTWRVATCPGDLDGACPAFTLDNVFGAGASYGFVRDGVYRFHGGGRAEARLRIVSARLPARTADLIDVGGGTQAGEPVYLLARGVTGMQHGLLYRSLDGGHSWQPLPVALSPTSPLYQSISLDDENAPSPSVVYLHLGGYLHLNVDGLIYTWTVSLSDPAILRPVPFEGLHASLDDSPDDFQAVRKGRTTMTVDVVGPTLAPGFTAKVLVVVQ